MVAKVVSDDSNWSQISTGLSSLKFENVIVKEYVESESNYHSIKTFSILPSKGSNFESNLISSASGSNFH